MHHLIVESLAVLLAVAIFTLKMVAVAIFKELAVKYAKVVLVRSQREAALWVHYYNHSARSGHTDKSPIVCMQGKCRSL